MKGLNEFEDIYCNYLKGCATATQSACIEFLKKSNDISLIESIELIRGLYSVNQGYHNNALYKENLIKRHNHVYRGDRI